MPSGARVTQVLQDNMWDTGRPWTELHFSTRMEGSNIDPRTLRMSMRHSNGLLTRWTKEGLSLQFNGQVREVLKEAVQERKKIGGHCYLKTVEELPIHQIWIGAADGRKQKWADYKAAVPVIRGMKVKDYITFQDGGDGQVRCIPMRQALPLQSRHAHWFRELALSITCSYPELVFGGPEPNLVDATHPLADKHHRFEMTKERSGGSYTRGRRKWTLRTSSTEKGIETAIARALAVPSNRVAIVPHPWACKMRPLWTGNRRWRQSRRGYKETINRKAAESAEVAQVKIHARLAREDPDIAMALQSISWRAVHRMEGVTPYQTQNITKLKMNRLKLWAGREDGFRCMATGCSSGTEGGSTHLVWKCREARAIWSEVLRKWGLDEEDGDHEQDGGRSALTQIFGFKLKSTPRWLTTWGVHGRIQPWGDLHQVADDMWRVACVITITAIWRRNVDRVHNDGRKEVCIVLAAKGIANRIAEAFARYRGGLYPLTAQTVNKIKVAEQISAHWKLASGSTEPRQMETRKRIGFFDGGSRGNPGPGGSGSVILEFESEEDAGTVSWAAATALGNPRTTNNIAEIVGLHRLLQTAQAKGWTGMQVIGDSALILGMMRNRTEPKAPKLHHWYRESRRLADLCQIASWSHHYRRHNKTADWLANYAMDHKRSVMADLHWADARHPFTAKLADLARGDVQQWKERRETQDN